MPIQQVYLHSILSLVLWFLERFYSKTLHLIKLVKNYKSDFKPAQQTKLGMVWMRFKKSYLLCSI